MLALHLVRRRGEVAPREEDAVHVGPDDPELLRVLGLEAPERPHRLGDPELLDVEGDPPPRCHRVEVHDLAARGELEGPVVALPAAPDARPRVGLVEGVVEAPRLLRGGVHDADHGEDAVLRPAGALGLAPEGHALGGVVELVHGALELAALD